MSPSTTPNFEAAHGLSATWGNARHREDEQYCGSGRISCELPQPKEAGASMAKLFRPSTVAAHDEQPSHA